MRYETRKLIETYKEYGNIVVGLDFDDTIYPLTDTAYIRDRCGVVQRLIKELRTSMKLCLWTVAADWSIKYKLTILSYMGIRADHVNESPIFAGDGVKKPIFNILLDDKAGLNEAIEILTEFKDTIK